MRNYFKDINLDATVKKNGFVVVPFLKSDELNALLRTFNTIPTNEINSFYATSHQTDVSFRKKMSELIKKNLSRSLNEYMIDMDLLGGSYIAKPPKYEHVLQPHQDWNIVDEEKFRSFNIWIPLVDLDESNGAIMVMPGSHRWIKSYRHASIPCAFKQVHNLILEYMTPLYLRAGEALIYDHALLHASQPNRSDKMRIACASGVKPEEADMVFYWNNNGKVEEYNSSPDFFMQENVFTGPHGLKKQKEVAYDFHSVSEEEFYELSGIEKNMPTEIARVQEDSAPQIRPSFFEVYTLGNILREIKYRLSG